MNEMIVDPLYEKRIQGGLKLSFRDHLDGGGQAFFVSFMEAIGKINRHPYQRGFEWCAGAGFLGFSLLSMRMLQHCTFQDVYPTAIDVCNHTINNNFLSKRAEAYVCGTIKDLPPLEPWDFVISNPPHAWDLRGSRESLLRDGVEHHAIENTIRLLVDDDMQAHSEFFQNIRSRLTDTADLFIVEHDQKVRDIYIEMAEAGGLKLIDIMPCYWIDKDNGHKIYSFQPK